jgi:hypothetical protein
MTFDQRVCVSEQEEILKRIPTRGHYFATAMGSWYAVGWRHGVSQRILVQFLQGPNVARKIAESLNFVHVDERTGETTRNWNLLKLAWWDGKDYPEPSRLILPTGLTR